MKPNNPVTPEVALIADLAKFDSDSYCEGCGAPLWAGDDYVTDPDGVSGCWAAMTDLPSKQPRPCYAYRVGRPSAGATMVEQGPDVEAMVRRAFEEGFYSAENSSSSFGFLWANSAARAALGDG